MLNSRRRGTAAAAVSVLALLAVAGWLQPVFGSRDRTAAVDGAALAGVVRAGISVARLAEAPDDAAAARRAQADLISAISLVPRLPGEASRNELDALLIRTLDSVQPLTSGGDDSVAADAGERLARAAESIDSEVAALVDEQPADERDSRLGLAGLVLSLRAGIGALLVVGGRRTTSPLEAGGTVAASRAIAGRPPVLRGRSAEPQPRSVASLPLDVLDAARFRRELARERSRSSRYGHELSLMTVSLVQGDSIVRDHGPDALEYVLGSIAELAHGNTRASDVVGVTEDNQIVVLLAETSVADAEHVATKLRRSVEIFPFSDNIMPTISTTCTDVTSESS
ncbi:MAG: GGDEF domain-containing protein [Spirochaetota bacterium]